MYGCFPSDSLFNSQSMVFGSRLLLIKSHTCEEVEELLHFTSCLIASKLGERTECPLAIAFKEWGEGADTDISIKSDANNR